MMQEEILYNIGVERESLRCTEDGKLALTPHPSIFGDRMNNNFIATDWGEAQIEIRTPVCKSTEDCYKKLEEITNVVLAEIRNNNELLWPYSMPCKLPEKNDFTFGQYGDGEKGKIETEYDIELDRKYGYKMHCISGIHVNFNLTDFLINKIKSIYPNTPEQKDDIYCKMMNNFVKRAWQLMYYFGSTPIQIEGDKKCVFSLRNTDRYGFGNGETLEIDYSSKENYLSSIENLINSGKVLCAREIYSPVRAKSRDKNNMLQDLKDKEISYVEIRVLDLNPFDKCGISKKDLDFIVVFLINCLIDETIDEYDYKNIAEFGINEKQHEILLQEFNKYRKINKELGLNLDEGIEEMYNVCHNKSTRASLVENIGKYNELIPGMIKLAKEHRDNAYKERYTIKSYPKLETSTMTLIKDAITQGIDYNIISEEKSFIELLNNQKREFIIQATRTSRDSYIFPYITDDKFFAKRIMKENGICIPDGIMLSKNDLNNDSLISKFYNKKVVIKPRTTNCGIGITVFEKPASEKEIKNAIEYAFQFDDNVLLEEFIQGNEYRFLCIDGKCLSIVWRRSASVIGDGKSTIRELIEKKRKEPWHDLLRKPVKIDPPMEEFLNSQGYTLDYIVPMDKRIYLRKNSNVSTGGESVDMTEVMPKFFKDVAEKTAKIFDAKICGIDIIINDITKNDYKMIEINDNPGISINEWPYEGKGRRIGLDILKLLDLI